MVLKKANNDHWAFLDEIDAPMWVDLAVEANFNNQDINDEWFHTSHLFHQRSSCQLKSAFSHCGECTSTSDFDKQISTSPKLPSSVSRSRGKHYRSKRWRLENCESLLNKQHPVKVLSGKSSCLDSQFGEEIQPKLSFRNLRGTLRSKSSLVCESIHTGNAIPSCSKPVSTFGDPASRSSSMGNKASGSSTRSTITTQSTHQQKQNYREVLTQPSGPGTLRKSCITGQASRLDMNNERKLSKGYKSSSGKSSVGSSSSLLYDAKSSTSSLIHHKETNPVSRNVARMTYAAKNKAQTSSVSNASTTKIAGSSNARMRTKVSFVKSAQQEAAKPKVQHQTLNARALLPLRVNKQEFPPIAIQSKEQIRACRPNRLAGSGEENATGRMTERQKCSSRGIVAVVRDRKRTKQSVQQTRGTRLIGSKGNVTDRCEENKRLNVTPRPRVYLR